MYVVVSHTLIDLFSQTVLKCLSRCRCQWLIYTAHNHKASIASNNSFANWNTRWAKK